MTKISIRPRSHGRAAAGCALISTLLLSGCSSMPEPTVALTAAEQAIATADRTRVADTSSPDLSEAREKLTAARAAAQEKRMIEAERLALESRVSAELASARVEAFTAKAVNEEMKRSTDTLSQEMQRNTGAKQ